ncbi:MAG: hypothetical protein JSS76_03310 [Bacteroidetes bacterium]|nr:hypothetical protein [Bacteroidota bacterium]
MDIRTVADRINEYSKQLAEGTLSEIERDILLADLRALYLLAKGDVTVPHTMSREPINDVESVPVVSVPVIEDVAPVVERVEPVLAPVKPVIEFINDEPIIKKEQEAPKPEVKPIVEVIEAPVKKEEEAIKLETRRIHYHEGSPVRGPRPSSLNEVFTGEERSLNTIAGGEKKRALNDRIAGTDLNSLLDLNRKHVLTAELFGGDSQAFQTAIRRINESLTIEAAFEYIKTDLLPKYQWKGDMQSAKLFDKLVRQKFGV